MRRRVILNVVLLAWAVVFLVSGVFCAVYETEEWTDWEPVPGTDMQSRESYYRRPYSDLAGLLFFVSLLFFALALFAFWAR